MSVVEVPAVTWDETYRADEIAPLAHPSGMETSVVIWGETRLPYTIRRSPRRKKTVAVTVDPAGGVLLVAPVHLAVDQLDGIVARKAGWIVRRLRRAQTHGPPRSQREFVSGESVLYLGRHYRLKVHPLAAGEARLPHDTTGEAKPRGEAMLGGDAKLSDAAKLGGVRLHGEAKLPGDAKSGGGWLPGDAKLPGDWSHGDAMLGGDAILGGVRLHGDAKLCGDAILGRGRLHAEAKLPGDWPHGGAKLRGGWLHVPAPAGVEQAAHVRAALVAWLRRHAAARLPERVEAWRAKAGVAMPRVVVADQRKRWGSCDRSGTIRLNWRIIQAPMRLIDYVVVHELVHLRHRGHGRDYWRAVGRVMPDYERRREELRRCGAGLAW